MPDTITIPVPIASYRHNNGLLSMNTHGRHLTIRYHNTELSVVDEVSTSLNMSRSDFVRWVTIEAAKALKEEIDNGRLTTEPRHITESPEPRHKDQDFVDQLRREAEGSD